jgi:hypothetical protein
MPPKTEDTKLQKLQRDLQRARTKAAREAAKLTKLFEEDLANAQRERNADVQQYEEQRRLQQGLQNKLRMKGVLKRVREGKEAANAGNSDNQQKTKKLRETPAPLTAARPPPVTTLMHRYKFHERKRQQALAEQFRLLGNSRNKPGPRSPKTQQSVRELDVDIKHHTRAMNLLRRQGNLRAYNNEHANRVRNNWSKNRPQRESLAFQEWASRQLSQQQANLVKQFPDPPSAKTAAFQTWMKSLFTTQRGLATRHPLVSAMRTPAGMSPHEAIRRMVSGQMDGSCSGAPSSDTASLQAHQVVVHVMAQLRAASKLDTTGLLVMHSTGAGKTLTTLAAMLAYWNYDMPIILVSTNDNRTGITFNTHAQNAMLFFRDFEDNRTGTPIKIFNNGDHRDPVAVSAVAGIIQKRVREGLKALFRARSNKSMALKDTQKNRAIYTFAELGNDINAGYVNLRDRPSLIIVDEVQYLVSPPEPHFLDSYAAVRKALLTRHPGSWCVGLTATPGETVQEVVQLMNCIQGPVRNPMKATDSIDVLRQKAMGHVSYAYLLGDKSRFAQVRMRMACSYLVDATGKKSYYHDPYFTKLHTKFSAHPRFPEQAKAFLSEHFPTTAKISKAQTHLQNELWEYTNDKAHKLLQPIRKLSLYIQLNEQDHKQLVGSNNNNNNTAKRAGGRPAIQELFIGHTKAQATGPRKRNEGNENDDGDDENASMALVTVGTRRPRNELQRLHRYLLSPKIPQLINFVYNDLESPSTRRGIHYIYTTDTITSLLVAHALEKTLGMPQLKNAAEYEAKKHLRPFFVLWDNSESSVDIMRPYTVRDYKKSIASLKPLVNSPANRNGDIIKVVIATKQSFKGVDLKNIRYLHLLDPLVNFRDFIQFVGRGPRYCSHVHHPDQHRFVEVVLYRMVLSPQHECDTAHAALPDCFIWKEAYGRYFGKGKFSDIEDNVLWRASVDYEVFKDNLHSTRDALRVMVQKLRCNTRNAITKNNVGNANPANALAHHNGFQQLLQNARKKLSQKALATLKKQQPNQPANMQAYKEWGKQLDAIEKEIKHKLDEIDNDKARLKQARKSLTVSMPNYAPTVKQAIERILLDIEHSRKEVANLEKKLVNVRDTMPAFKSMRNFAKKMAKLKAHFKEVHLDVTRNNLLHFQPELLNTVSPMNINTPRNRVTPMNINFHGLNSNNTNNNSKRNNQARATRASKSDLEAVGDLRSTLGDQIRRHETRIKEFKKSMKEMTPKVRQEYSEATKVASAFNYLDVKRWQKLQNGFKQKYPVLEQWLSYQQDGDAKRLVADPPSSDVPAVLKNKYPLLVNTYFSHVFGKSALDRALNGIKARNLQA